MLSSVSVAWSCGRELGTTVVTRMAPSRLAWTGLHRGDVRGGGQAGAQRARQLLDLPAAGSVARLDDDGERAVGAGPEPRADRVVGLLVAVAGRVRARVDVPQPQGQQGDGQHAEEQHAGQQEAPRVRADRAGVPGPACVTGRRLGDGTAHPEPVDAAAGQPEQGRDQGQRAQRTDRDADRGGHAESAEEADPRGVQAQHGDDHGDRGDQHGPAAGGHRPAGRLGRVGAVDDLLPVPGGQEQRVVDADAEAHHHGRASARRSGT